MTPLLNGLYATRLYLPFSSLSRRLRRISRRLRGKKGRFLQATLLPQISWTRCGGSALPRVWEAGKANGNVRVSELAILAALAATCRPGSTLVEIGTFDGRTTLNLAFNAPPDCPIHTLDLPPGLEPKFKLATGEGHLVQKPTPGTRYEGYRDRHPENIGRIHQHLGDSATFDFSPHHGACSLVFIDGSHAYDYAVSDTGAAMDMVEPGGVIVWHDYGIWKGVTQALDEIEKRDRLGLRNISGTSLVIWRKPQA